MRKISIWAKHHIYLARTCIVLIKAALFFMAIYSGKSIAGLGITIPGWFFTASLIVLFITVITYPETQRNNKGKSIYTIRKTTDFVLCLSSFTLVVMLANREQTIWSNSSMPYVFAASIKDRHHTAQQILASLQYRDKSTLTRHEKRILKREFASQLKTYVKAELAGDKKTAGQVGLVILTIIGAIGLTYLLAALACSVACSGADGLAILILAVGLTGIIWGTIALINYILKRRKTKETSIPETTFRPTL